MDNFDETWEKLQKHPRYENPKYLEWVKTQPCVITGMPADEPHHACGLGLGGMGTKAPDWAAMPMTRGAHTYIHETPEIWPDQWRWIAETLGRAIEEGVI